jgi:hypothetical protein
MTFRPFVCFSPVHVQGHVVNGGYGFNHFSTSEMSMTAQRKSSADIAFLYSSFLRLAFGLFHFVASRVVRRNILSPSSG